MGERYDEITNQLQHAYDKAVDARASSPVEPWKEAEREKFLAVLHREGAESLLEIGAGTGVHGKFFADAGLDVVCTDLTAGMVEYCRSQGLVAFQQDFLHLDLGRAFDAVFAMNCLLHVPREDLSAALASVRSTLKPGGVFYLGQYGGFEGDGFPDDPYEPKRFFSLLRDEDLCAVAAEHFHVDSFTAVNIDFDGDGHFQSLLLRAS
jgi:SAM-dependent methyltransferase